MQKRGQVTVFIIVGMVVFFLVLILSSVSGHFFKERLEVEEERVAPTAAPVKLFIEDCLSTTAKKGVFSIGLQGSYYDMPELYHPHEFVEVPFYFYQGQEHFPEKEVFEVELSKHIKGQLPSCLNDFQSFRNAGYEFTLGELGVESSFIGKIVRVNMNYPLTIIKGSSIQQLHEFSSDIDFDFNEKYSYVERLINQQKVEHNSVPLGYLTQLSYEKDFKYKLGFYPEDAVLVDMIFNESLGDVYILSFALKYDWAKGTEFPSALEGLPSFEELQESGGLS